MTRFIDLTAVSAVEEEMKDVIGPFLESQRKTQEIVQGFLDANEASIKLAATALSGFAENVARMGEILPNSGILDSFREMQKLTEIAKITFDLPQIVPLELEPIRFGNLCVEVMEDEEGMIPALIPDRPLTEKDVDRLAMRVVEVLKAGGLVVAAPKPVQPKLLNAPTIRDIVLVRLENRDKVRVVVNGNYQGSFLNGLGKYWRYLLRLAEKEQFKLDDLRGMLDYFNTNARCSLYTRSGLGITQILQIENDRIIPTVSIDVISEKAYKTRLNKGT